MKNISFICFYCFALLVSAEGCLDPATLNPTAIHSTVKLFQNIRPAENIDVLVGKIHYRYECKNSKLGTILSAKPRSGYVTRQYFVDDKIIITYSDNSTYEIRRGEEHVTYIKPLGHSLYRNGTCSGEFSKVLNTYVVEFINITLYIDHKALNPKTVSNSYVFPHVRVYTLSKSPLVQYALLGDEEYFLPLHLKEPYNISTEYINADYNAIIDFGQHDNVRSNKSTKEFLRMYGTFAGKALKLMMDHCEIIVFQENNKVQGGTCQDKVDHNIIIIFYGLCVILSCLLNFWMFRRTLMMKSDIKKIEDSLLVLSFPSQVKNVAESSYDYIECLNKISSENAYDKVIIKPQKLAETDRKSTTASYLTPVNSVKAKPSNNYVTLENIEQKF